MRGLATAAVDRRRGLNVVSLQHAVLCADCDCVSDSPHDRCLVCGSQSLFNISRILGGNLPKNRAALTGGKAIEPRRSEVVLTFPRLRRVHPQRQSAARLELPTSSAQRS
jgi:hypothetical protein